MSPACWRALALLIAGLAVVPLTAGELRPAIPDRPNVPITGANPPIAPWVPKATTQAPLLAQSSGGLPPATFATAPRGYGPNYFKRSSYAGPSRRGLAYDVRRREG